MRICELIFYIIFRRWEQYLVERGVGGQSKQINFSDYRNKIADPTFVDDLEIKYFVERNTISSISNMDTLNSWPQSSISSFKEECEKTGDQLVRPLSPDDKLKQETDLKNAELYVCYKAVNCKRISHRQRVHLRGLC